MADSCLSCGRSSEKLFDCEECGVDVCAVCKEQIGCKMCGGLRSLY